MPSQIYRKDYCKHDFTITHSELEIDLDFVSTRIKACHWVKRNKESLSHSLKLDCEQIEIGYVMIDGIELRPQRWSKDDDKLVIYQVSDSFELEIVNYIAPAENSALSGLYRSGDMLCSQCEAEGFRRITPAIDRPDNLATYRITLCADAGRFPVLLCNGNLLDSGQMENGRHWTTWEDPFVKPTYLFAIVAGPLALLEDTYVTTNGRSVSLRFYARGDDINKCAHAVDSLKRAMRWDEQVYGLEYDLELYNVVAVNDFNMGAMENKSLNIFNTQYILAGKDSTTDAELMAVEGVIAHEYFHNWSGNRVTCRDWFQLSLKEGFTVYRDQEFSADMNSSGVKRIKDANIIRNHQFREDTGPMSHPVRPDSYQEINNFYTVTVYNKGAELIRMLRTIVGSEIFYRGCGLYFKKYDGQAVTTDDFIAAFEQVGDINLDQFKLWYSQAGTPEIEVEHNYDADNQSWTLSLQQSCSTMPNQTTKQPFVIPIRLALFDQQGEKLKVSSSGDPSETVVMLTKKRQQFKFGQIQQQPVASILRGFSAPIKLKLKSPENHLFLLKHDDDPFNRWHAMQQLLLNNMLSNLVRAKEQLGIVLDETVCQAFEVLLLDPHTDPALLALTLTLPTEVYLADWLPQIDPYAVRQVRRQTRHALAQHFEVQLRQRYDVMSSVDDGNTSSVSMAARSLRDTCLIYLAAGDNPEHWQLAISQLRNSRCMTDTMAALTSLTHSSCPQTEQLLEQFYGQWKHDDLVVDKWLRLQALSDQTGVLNRVRQLTHHPVFSLTNPNKVYSLLNAFAQGNPAAFHTQESYCFIREKILEIDPINPQLSARLVSAFNHWKRYLPSLQSLMQTELETILRHPDLSKDVSEIVGKALG